MTLILQRELEKVRELLLNQRIQVESACTKAVAAFRNRDIELARQVVEGDAAVDALEVRIESECLRVLTLQHPVATDLRFLVAVFKVNPHLERLGDLAVNIAKRSIYFARHRDIEWPPDLHRMAGRALSMVVRALAAFAGPDEALAREVYGEDDEVDRMRREFLALIARGIQERPEHTESWMELSSLVRHLERMADVATHVAEEVIYYVTGEIVRHVK